MSEIEAVFSAIGAIIEKERVSYKYADTHHMHERRKEHHQVLQKLVPAHRAVSKYLQQQNLPVETRPPLMRSKFALAYPYLVQHLVRSFVWVQTVRYVPTELWQVPLTAESVRTSGLELVSHYDAEPWAPEGTTLGELAESWRRYVKKAKNDAAARTRTRLKQETEILSRLEADLTPGDWSILKSMLKPR